MVPAWPKKFCTQLGRISRGHLNSNRKRAMLGCSGFRLRDADIWLNKELYLVSPGEGAWKSEDILKAEST